MTDWKIEFFNPQTDKTIGYVTFADGVMTPDDKVHSIVDGDKPADVLDRYGDWSNGYLSSRLVDAEA